MQRYSFKKGTTSKILLIDIYDSSSTTGARLAGLVYNTASLTAYYNREGAAGAATAITLATATKGTWATGGFIAIDNTNMPGHYELHIPDAALATGANSVLIELKGATNMVPKTILIELTAIDNQDSVRMGLTALPNAAAEAAGGLYTRGTGAGQINQPANGRVDVNTIAVSGTTQTAGDIIADTNDIQSRLPAALVSGRIDSSVGSNLDKTGYSIGNGGIASTAFAAGAIDAASLAADATTELTAGIRIKKNTALSNFMFLMVDSTDHVTPKTGLTITATRSIDGAAFAACANSATEVANGMYKINLANTDLNGDVITLRFTGTGADDRLLTLITTV